MDVEQKSKVSSREVVALDLARLIDAAVDDRVLVLGSLPPRGRDLELVVRPAEQLAVAERLTAEGLARRGLEWAWFFDSTAYAVELIPAERLSLSADELAALFDEARTLDDLDLANVVRPAPHHVVLLQARRLIRDGRLHPKRRARLQEAVTEDAEAWAKAKTRAASWSGRVVVYDRFVCDSAVQLEFWYDETVASASRSGSCARSRQGPFGRSCSRCRLRWR